MVRLLLGLFWIGGRRLSHVDYVRSDPLVCRLARLRLLPHERTLSRWLKQFTWRSVRVLAELNTQLVGETLRRLRCRRVTLDVDGSVVSTGLQVAWAQRGYNPHHRKVPSYYPILAMWPRPARSSPSRTAPATSTMGSAPSTSSATCYARRASNWACS